MPCRYFRADAAVDDAELAYEHLPFDARHV